MYINLPFRQYWLDLKNGNQEKYPCSNKLISNFTKCKTNSRTVACVEFRLKLIAEAYNHLPAATTKILNQKISIWRKISLSSGTDTAAIIKGYKISRNMCTILHNTGNTFYILMGSTQKSFITKWGWFLQEHITKRTDHIYEHVEPIRQ